MRHGPLQKWESLFCVNCVFSANQGKAAEEFVSKGTWVSKLVLTETMWVLDAVYGRSPEQIATAVDMLVNHNDLTIQDSDTVAAALEQFRARPCLGLSDCLIVEIVRKAGHIPVGTSDRDCARLPDTALLR